MSITKSSIQKHMSRVAKVADAPETRLEPGNSTADQQHAKDIAKIERIHQSRLK